ncbi:hypothetical protein BJV82DRAFT_594547 [Fennellomyces sp. T-0311]|nr:hypothetical protein BJV82DRAFT_594547 [Fennellomyces sp. T-0311]
MLQFAYNSRPLSGKSRHFKIRPSNSSPRIVPLILVALLLVACVSFLSSLSEMAFSPEQSPPPLRHSAHEQERFLAYLPHSGLSNQRIELANALALATILQRTLIVPPAFLGTVVGWMKKEQIYEHLGWLTNASVPFESICRPSAPGDLASYVHRSRCGEYRRFGVIPWTDLHDLDSLSSLVNIRYHDMVSLNQLQHDLGVSENDTYVHSDQHLYDWRLYEDLKVARNLLKTNTNFVDSFAGRRYYKVYTLKHWQRRPERLLQLGGIFGSTRLNFVDPEHIALRNRIANALHYRRDTPIGETVRNIVEYLGGQGSFVGVHFRTGDQPFKRLLRKNMLLFAQGMAELTNAPSIPTEDDMLPAVEAEDQVEDDARVPLLPPENGLHVPPWSTVCRNVPKNGAPITSGFRTVVYIATDHRNPRGADSKLLPWFDTFPCTVTLNDLPDHLFEPLDRVHDMIVPEKPLRNFLIPIVDAMVAAHAKQVFATPRSTFSKYIAEMNRAWVS